MLLGRPGIGSGESFSGYLQRICRGIVNPMSIWEFLIKNRNRYPQASESAMLDRFPNKALDLNQLMTLIGLNVKQIEGLTFLGLSRSFVGSDGIHSQTRILSGELEGNRKFCPVCLKEDGFYQLLWQVREIEVCLRHRVHLVKVCPNCQQPVKYLFSWAQVGYCHCGFNLKSIKKMRAIQENEILEHDRIWRDWQQLIDSFTVPDVHGFGPKRSLAIAILYVANDFSSRFKGIDAIASDLNRATISSVLQAARESRATDTLVHIRTLLTVLREKELPVAEFAKLRVPDSFVNSIHGRPVKPIQKYSCLAPWCKSFGKNDGLKKTGTSSKIRMDGSKLKYYFYCQDCGIEYALNEKDEMVERGNFIDIGWGQVKELVLANKSRRQIAQELNITVDQVMRCTAFLATNGLLPKEARNKFLGKPEDKELLNKILREIKSGVHIKTIQRDLNLHYHEFLYYRYKAGAIKAINSVVKKREPKIDPGENHIKVLGLLKELVNEEAKITIELVAKRLGVCPETLRNWDVLPLIAEYKEQQQREKDQKFASELKVKAKIVIQSLVDVGEEVKSETVYNQLGVRRNVLVRKFPDATRYIASLLKEQRAKEHQAKFNEYVSVAKSLIETAKYSGQKVTVEDVAEALELSVAGISRYPQILQLLKQGT